MEHHVRDTELIIISGRPVDRTVPQAIRKPIITKRREPRGKDGELIVTVVSKEEMERLWK